MATEKRLIAYDPITFEAFTRSITKHRGPYDYYDDGYIDAVERIEEWLEQNTVDAVPVVRCKACKHSALYEDGTIFCKLHSEQGEKEERSGSYSVWMEPDDFCSYGERRIDK